MVKYRQCMRLWLKHWQEALWATSEQGAPFYKRVIRTSLRIAYSVGRDVKNGQLSLQAMSLVYTTMISIVPLLALSFAVLKGLGIHNQIEVSLLNFLQPLGEHRFDIVHKIIEFVDNVKIGVLSTVGLLVLIYTAIAMVTKVERAFNAIWQVKRGRSTARRFSDYFSMIFMGPLLIFLSMGFTRAIGHYKITTYLISLPLLGNMLQFIEALLSYVVLACVFALIYRFTPCTRVAASSALVGGMVTAVVWKTMGWLFASLIAHTTTQTVIYSAFASAMLLMVWMYWGWLILLVGASIAFYHQKPTNQCYNQHIEQLSQADQQRLLLNVSYCIARAFYQGKMGISAQTIANQLVVSVQWIDWCIDHLLALHFAVQTTGQPACYVLSQPPNQLYIHDIIDRFYCKGSAKLESTKTPMDRYLEHYRYQLLVDKTMSYESLLKEIDKTT